MPPKLEIDGLQFAEGPRWHADALWCSDMFGHCVVRRQPGHEPEEFVRMPFDNPSGLGWLVSGEMLVVGMQTQAVYRTTRQGNLQLHADLSGLAKGMANDMVVAPNGTAYVDDSGLPRFGQSGARCSGQILAAHRDGSVVSVAEDLEGPNGIVLTPDGSTLIVAESFAGRLTAFDVAPDGSLLSRRVHAELAASARGEQAHPDGICIDAEGGVWVADLTVREVLRIGVDRAVTDSIPFGPLIPVACALGGQDMRRLFVCLSEHWDIAKLGKSAVSRVISVEVSIPGV
jgi:sugar lactone lactonase YvrE